MSKYRNKRTIVDGIKFASKAEANRYGVLKILEKGGKIVHLKLQPRYPFLINGVKVCSYVGDFEYFDKDLQRWVLEDVKGHRTRDYVIKKNLMKACFGRDITEVAA